MSVRDRILAACCGDTEQAELVEQMMGRLLGRQSGTDGSLPSLVPEELSCHRCGTQLDTEWFCAMCGEVSIGSAAGDGGRRSRRATEEGT